MGSLTVQTAPGRTFTVPVDPLVSDKLLGVAAGLQLMLIGNVGSGISPPFCPLGRVGLVTFLVTFNGTFFGGTQTRLLVIFTVAIFWLNGPVSVVGEPAVCQTALAP